MIDILWKVFVALGLIVGCIILFSIVVAVVQSGIDAVREAREEEDNERTYGD